MTVEVCPVCRAAMGVALDQISKYAQVRYFRCAHCGHVWTVSKDGDAHKNRDVTPRAPGQKPQRDTRPM